MSKNYVLLTFDIKDGESKDYSKLNEYLEEKGFSKSSGNKDLPNNTYVAETEDVKKLIADVSRKLSNDEYAYVMNASLSRPTVG